MKMDARQEAGLGLEEIVARDPATALYLPLAERLVDQGRVADAIRLCEERRTRPGRGVGDRIVLGRAYLAEGRLSDALVEFKTALDLDRENVVALKALGGILSHQGHHGEAASYYRAVCRVDPGDIESQSALHQITSGEYSEVRPADVIVDQGTLNWQPVGLPKEEEHLPELALGLRNIESFTERSGRATPPASRDHLEAIPLEGLAAASPGTASPGELGSRVEISEEPSPRGPGSAAASRELPPVPVPPPRPGAIVEGNRSAFETWLRQLTGKES